MSVEKPQLNEEQPPESGEIEKKPPSSGRRGDFGISGAEQLAALEAKVEALRAEAAADPEKARSLEVAEKRLELFVNEHDNAGAFKFKKFGRETVNLFEDSPDKPRVVEVDKDGHFTLAEGEKNRRMMFVNMGELDRINKEGGSHKAGDDALTETVKTIEAAIQRHFKDRGKTGKQAQYTMLRYKGNEFMATFDDISKDDMDAIMDEVRAAKPTIGEGVEGAPLVAQGFEFQQALNIVNELQLELGPDERLDLSDPRAAASEFIEVMKRQADYNLDIDKFTSRVGRVRDKLADLDVADARAFFDNYMKKMFQGTELQDLLRFETLRPEEIQQMAFAHAGKYLESAKDRNDAKRAIIDARVKEIRDKKGERPSQETGPAALGPAGKLAKVPERTRGQAVLDALEKKLEQAEAGGNAEDIEIAKLELQIETARRDSGTGLNERGVHYEKLEQAFKGEGKEVQLAFVDMGFLRYFDNKGGADVGNDALKVAADLMVQAIETSGVKGEAFRYGGDEFTVQIEGGPLELAKFNQALEDLRKNAGAIPTGKRGTKDGYHPTELAFNYGAADTAIAAGVFESLKEAGKFTEADLADPEMVANMKADIMTTIADKAIEEQKALTRFDFVIKALKDPAYETDPARKVQVDNLIVFSTKAIFGEAGGGDLARALAKSEASPEEVRQQIKEFVDKNRAMAREKEGKKDELMNKLVEVHGKISYYERELKKARLQAEGQAAERTALQTKLDAMQKERDQLIQVRKVLE